MDFNTIVKNTFSELLTKAGFSILVDEKTEVSYKSEKVTIKFINYSYGGEYYYFVKLNDQEREYEDFLIERFLKITKIQSSKKTQLNNTELWASENLQTLIKFKDLILKGDKPFYSDLNNYFEEESLKYTKKYT